MTRRLLASLIVCVALLTQIGASLAGAAAARDGYVGRIWCHDKSSLAGAAGLPAGEPAKKGVPAPHDHASCVYCQNGADAAPIEAVEPAPRVTTFYWRALFAETEASLAFSAFNRSAPARAPPFSA